MSDIIYCPVCEDGAIDTALINTEWSNKYDALICARHDESELGEKSKGMVEFEAKNKEDKQ